MRVSYENKGKFFFASKYVWVYVSVLACIFDHIHCLNIYHVLQSRFPRGTLGLW